MLFFNNYSFEEKNGKFTLEVDVPSFKKEELSIDYNNYLISISGKNKKRTLNKTFQLPFRIDADNINAKLEDGVLILEFKKPENKQIQIE